MPQTLFSKQEKLWSFLGFWSEIDLLYLNNTIHFSCFENMVSYGSDHNSYGFVFNSQQTNIVEIMVFLAFFGQK